MAYSCYTRYEGRGLVEVQPIVTIRFDQLHTVTRNRVRKTLQDNYCPYTWSSKPQAILNALRGHYKMFTSLMDRELIGHPDFDREIFAAKALLLDFKFQVLDNVNLAYWHHGYGHLTYIGSKSYDDRQPQVERMNKLKQDTLLPIARSFIDHDKLAPIMDALESRQPYSFPGVNMR